MQITYGITNTIEQPVFQIRPCAHYKLKRGRFDIGYKGSGQRRYAESASGGHESVRAGRTSVVEGSVPASSSGGRVAQADEVIRSNTTTSPYYNAGDAGVAPFNPGGREYYSSRGETPSAITGSWPVAAAAGPEQWMQQHGQKPTNAHDFAAATSSEDRVLDNKGPLSFGANAVVERDSKKGSVTLTGILMYDPVWPLSRQGFHEWFESLEGYPSDSPLLNSVGPNGRPSPGRVRLRVCFPGHPGPRETEASWYEWASDKVDKVTRTFPWKSSTAGACQHYTLL